MRTAKLRWIDPRYEVTDGGDVLSYAGRWSKRLVPIVLKKHVSNSGYCQVRLPAGEKRFKWYSVARLVLRAFTGKEGEQTNHKNGMRTDDRLKNLEWCTMSENMRHSYRALGRKHPRPQRGKFGALHSNSKKVAQIDTQGRVVRVWDALQEAARAGYSAGNISAVCRGERRTHKGFSWKHV